MRQMLVGLAALGCGWLLLVVAGADEPGPDGELHVFAPSPVDAFRPSTLCARCHSEGPRATAMRDANGADISPVGLWQSSMMANASRDPVWRAAVAVEAAATPARRAAIETACLRCHAPMAAPGQSLAGLILEAGGDELAADGASCTVCHRIRPEGLGKEDSFSGGWRIDEGILAFGPHAEPFARPMRMQTGLLATESKHVLEPALCATCHTLTTPALAPDGSGTGGHLPEQTPYLEWRNSIYSTEREDPSAEARTCQDCHLPTRDDEGRVLHTRIARNPGGRDFPRTDERSPFGRHVLVGGNALVPRLLGAHRALLDVPAPRAAFDRTVEAAEGQLRAAATLDLVALSCRDDVLHVDVAVQNATGHRFPTAHPTRRAWIALRVLDGQGDVLFQSGGWDAEGRIVDATGEPLPAEVAGGPTHVHRDEVTASTEVALYEAQMVDAGGQPTWLLMRGERFGKDDRLLPGMARGRASSRGDASARRRGGCRLLGRPGHRALPRRAAGPRRDTTTPRGTARAPGGGGSLAGRVADVRSARGPLPREPAR